jgi:tRNA threonylcarbamoyl adenosine modification protein YeaZ
MILAIDTSLSPLRIGLFSNDGKELVSFKHTPEPSERGVHDKLLADETRKLLKFLDVKATAIKKIALINGPGSFTGLRIGLAFAKGLAFANSCPIIPLTAHEIMAVEFDGDGYLLYPGYQKGSYYAAKSTSPDDISLMNKEELLGKKLAGEASLETEFDAFTSLPLSLETVVKLAIKKEPADIATLEPFYIADFKPHPAAMQS